MITVFTTVGTSIINNYLEENGSVHYLYKTLEKLNISEKNVYQSDYDKFKKLLLSWALEQESNKICAEIKSINKIKEKFKDNLSVRFLATDTLLSVLCTEVIKEYFDKMKDNYSGDHFVFREDINIIKNTDVYKNKKFNKGIQNLINILLKDTYYENKYRNTIINFSGGYKSLIPYLTIYASICQIILCYIYEDSDELITIYPLHLKIDMAAMQKLEKFFEQIDKECAIDYPKELYNFESSVCELFNICTEEIEGKYTISTIGDMIWKLYLEYKEIELVEDETLPNKKKIKLSSTHHGNEILYAFSKKLVNSPYVKEIIDSMPYSPREREFISKIYDDGTIDIVLTHTDSGYGIKVKTTGRNYRETQKIANILKEKYGK